MSKIPTYTAAVVQLGSPFAGIGWESRPLVVVPEGATREASLWRAAQAHVTAGGEWSKLPDKKRFLVVTVGDGFHLTHQSPAGIIHKFLGPLSPYSFSGGDTTNCRLVVGSCTDINLMIDEARIEAAMEVFSPKGEATSLSPLTLNIPLTLGENPVDWYLLYCVQGAFQVTAPTEGNSIMLAQEVGVLLARSPGDDSEVMPLLQAVGRGEKPIAIGMGIRRLTS